MAGQTREEMVEHTELLLRAGHVHDPDGCDACAEILDMPIDVQLAIVARAGDRLRAERLANR